MERLVDDYEFRKVALCMRLFAKCSLTELKVVEQLHDNGELIRKSIKDQDVESVERMTQPVEQCIKMEPKLNGRVKYKLID